MKRYLLLLSAAWMMHLSAAETSPGLRVLTEQLNRTSDPATQKSILQGMVAGLQGRTGLVAPAEWATLAAKLEQSPEPEVRTLARRIGLQLGTPEALAWYRAMAANSAGPVDTRRRAIESLVARKDQEVIATLRTLVSSAGPLRSAAIRGLVVYEDERTGASLLEHYASMTAEEKRETLNGLAARPAWAKAVAEAIGDQRIARTEVSAALIRQLRGFKDARIDSILDERFGKLSGSTNKQSEINGYRGWLTPAVLARGDAQRGRELFTRTCAVCHKLFDTGAEIGPELTGANRTDVDYLLQNIVDPNALIGADYQLQTIELTDGRVLAGMVKRQTAEAVTIRTMTEQVVVPAAEIKKRTVSPVSMMPEGLLQALSNDEVRDLFRYLSSSEQVPVR